MKTKGKPNEIDVVIGENLKKIRRGRELTQNDLAFKIGVTFQQIQKYENAKNRISASHLIVLAKALDVPLEHFYPEEYHTRWEKCLILFS